MSIEPALLSDVDELTELFHRFFEESTYRDRKIEYSPERAHAWLHHVIEFGIVPHIVARLGDRIIGVVSYDLDDTFCVKPVAVLHTIYVVPEYRRSAIGRMLIGLAAESSSSIDGACAFHAPVASGMADVASLYNLFTKAGFRQIGFIMGRSLN